MNYVVTNVSLLSIRERRKLKRASSPQPEEQCCDLTLIESSVS
jgi:hypothetical protein